MDRMIWNIMEYDEIKQRWECTCNTMEVKDN